MNIDAYLDDGKYGIYTYLLEQKKNGRIRHLGFSAHGSVEVMKRFLDAYGKDMEFCQIQLNYVDYEFQNAKGKIELLNSYGIPVWVMEPLRGGKLAKLPKETAEKLRRMRPDETIPAWAFRFLQSLPEVTVTLSGMSDLEQLKENIGVLSEPAPFSEQEMDVLLDAARDMIGNTLPCTACRYCTSHCPKGLDIPHLISLYNEHCFTGAAFLRRWRSWRCLRKSSRLRVWAAEAVRRSARSRSRSPRRWRIFRRSYPGGIEAQKLKLEAEGHVVISRGRKNIRYFVKDYETVLFEI